MNGFFLVPKSEWNGFRPQRFQFLIFHFTLEMSRSATTLNDFTIAALKELSLKRAASVIAAVSLAAFAFLIWLIYLKGGAEYSQDGIIAQLPALNAFFNSVSALFLVVAYRAIRRREYRTHMRFMLAAFVSSTLFLVSYVVYHNFHGHTVFPGEGLIRTVYLTILFSHIVLSAFVVPMILGSFFLAFAGKFRLHKRLSRFTFPIWMYVSVTGVLIFFLLKAYV